MTNFYVVISWTWSVLDKDAFYNFTLLIFTQFHLMYASSWINIANILLWSVTCAKKLWKPLFWSDLKWSSAKIFRREHLPNFFLDYKMRCNSYSCYSFYVYSKSILVCLCYAFTPLSVFISAQIFWPTTRILKIQR